MGTVIKLPDTKAAFECAGVSFEVDLGDVAVRDAYDQAIAELNGGERTNAEQSAVLCAFLEAAMGAASYEELREAARVDTDLAAALAVTAAIAEKMREKGIEGVNAFLAEEFGI